MGERHLFCVWNRDWVNALFDPNSLAGEAYRNALSPLPDSEFENWEEIMANVKAEANK